MTKIEAINAMTQEDSELGRQVVAAFVQGRKADADAMGVVAQDKALEDVLNKLLDGE